MTLDFSQAPFFDDFQTNAKASNYQKILFVPGNAVQARELTQIQSMLQNQIQTLGDSIFQNGTVVVPGNVFYDNTVVFLKMVSAIGTTTISQIGSQLIGQTLVGSTTGITAHVVFYTPATATDPDTLFIKYTSGSATTNVFASNEILTCSALGASVQISASTGSTGYGSICSISQGIYYVNGYFVGVDAQTIALDKYDASPSYSIGLNFVENIVAASQDPTLYDNALGFANYAAPGADRYQILLTLVANTTAFQPLTGQLDITFIPLLSVLNGNIQYLNNNTQYSAIEKMIAKRTYETSGDFVVTPFSLSGVSYLTNNRGQWTTATPYLADDIVFNAGIFYQAQTSGNSGSSAPTQTFGAASDGGVLWLQINTPTYNGGLTTLTSTNIQDYISAEANFILQTSPGKAYVQGYDVTVLGNQQLTIPKARTTKQTTSTSIYSPVGSYVQVTNVAGYVNTSTMTQVNLNDSTGVIRGTAFASMIEFVSGSIGPSTIFTGYISGTTLTVSTGPSLGTIYAGMPLYGAGITVGTTVVSGSGSSWVVSNSQTVASSGSPITITTSTGLYNLYLLDIKLNAGYDFTDDILSVSSTTGVTFSAQLVLYANPLSGFVTTTTGSNVVLGIGTLFTSNVKVGDQIQIAGVNNVVVTIVNDLKLTTTNNWSPGVTNAVISTLDINFINEGNYLQALPSTFIKNLRTSSGTIDTSYTVFKTIQFPATASTFISTLSIPGETFAGTSGHILVDTTTNLVVNSTFTLDGPAKNLTMTGTINTHTYALLARVTRSGSAALQKTKTLATKTIIIAGTNVTDTAGNVLSTSYNYGSPLISLFQTDVISISRITMSGTPTGTAPYLWSNYVATGESDITSQFSLNKNTNLQYYDVSSITRKGNTQYTYPIKVTFNYFAHSAGDYFSVDSYSNTPYDKIPTEIYNGVSYNLRDCLDFRSSIASDGLNFSDAGANVCTPLDPNVSMSTSYSYYLGRVDLISLTPTGTFEYTQGTPSDNPSTPILNDNSLVIGTAIVGPYTLNPSFDVNVIVPKQSGYTMADIANIDTRVSDIEQHVILSQLESATANLTIVDANGLNVYKNGFIADNFGTLNVSDVASRDFSASVDLTHGLLGPMSNTIAINLVEAGGSSSTSRAAAGYQITGDFITLAYTEVPMISQTIATNPTNINPFAVFSWTGNIQLTPSSDNWLDSTTIQNAVQYIPGTNTNSVVNQVNVQEYIQTSRQVSTGSGCCVVATRLYSTGDWSEKKYARLNAWATRVLDKSFLGERMHRGYHVIAPRLWIPFMSDKNSLSCKYVTWTFNSCVNLLQNKKCDVSAILNSSLWLTVFTLTGLFTSKKYSTKSWNDLYKDKK